MGIVLGLIGGGGSIISVPVLVYILNIDPVPATAYSLFIVGISALFGFFVYKRKKQVDFKTALYFGFPSVLAVFFTRNLIMPAIPHEIMNVGDEILTKDVLVMIVFAVLMLGAAYSMIKKNTNLIKKKPEEKNTIVLLGEGTIVGMVTGFVGAGGGFLIIPALVLFAGIEMKTAIGTSLLIIAAKSLIGFTGDLAAGFIPDWKFLFLFSIFSVLGILGGTMISKYFDGSKLKKIFGWSVLTLAIFILLEEIFT